MIPQRKRKRVGFTLIELIIVLSIIAVLLGLIMGAVFRIQVAQQVRSTNDVVEKVQVAIDNQFKAIIQQAATDIRTGAPQDAQAILNFMGQDQEAALALLTYCRVRQSFPQTFAEVQPFQVGGFPFYVKSQFLPFQGATAPNGLPSASQQSAILLYAAVAQTGAGGSVFASEATNSAKKEITLGTVTAPVYMDSWQQPIGFCRFGTNSELQAPPYVNLNTSGKYLDPFDPVGKLFLWAQTGQPNNQATATAQVIFVNPNLNDLANATTFNATNRRPVVYSNGYNQIYESLNNTPATINNKVLLDDILGYHLTQLGYKGTE